MKKTPKKKVGQYNFIEVIGRGNFAEVYLSIDAKNKQLVAIKCYQNPKLIKKIN